MNDISVAFANSFAGAGKYLPLLKELDTKLCTCYGIGFPRGYVITDEPIQKMKLTKIPTRISNFFISPICKILKKPGYYTYWMKIRIFDSWVANKISKDNSKIVYTSPLLEKTVKKCKESGKIVVLEAGNSEPEREYRRITEDYDKYKISRKYIYGNPVFKDCCKRSFQLADKIISISNTSLATYKNAGYDMSKFVMIPLTGTDFPIQYDVDYADKKEAFICTAFHNFIKGTQHLLLAWKKAEISNVPLIIVGRLCEDIKEFIDVYGPFDNVIFTGHNSALNKWYKDYDAVGVLMSLSEGAGRTTPEMMSFGFPMIVSPDATCDIVVNEVNGFVIDASDEDKLVERMKWFAEDWSRTKNMRKAILDSISCRSVKDFSLDLEKYLVSLL